MKNLTYCILLIVLILLGCNPERKDVTVVKGVVRSDIYDLPLKNATVSIGYLTVLGSNYKEVDRAQTNENGEYELQFNKRLNRSQYYIQFFYNGEWCKDTESELLDLNFQEENHLDFEMICSPTYLTMHMEATLKSDAFKYIAIQGGDTIARAAHFIYPHHSHESFIRKRLLVAPYDSVWIEIQYRDYTGEITTKTYDILCDPEDDLYVYFQS
ncbi:hypothetical protein KFE98_17840 [bacterium SCSIO 12741]|nr:hypothetical protein KFE98_17840 [bacterium SCSIO 12741]